ncbi:MAG: hypothetical protein PHE53_13040 [Thermoguttaceae bacterium]|nr:hypothetical protein [Thermoguttaceae bacterium]
MDQEPKRNEAAFPVIWTITDVSIWIDLLNLVCNRIIDPKLIERIRVPVLRDEHGFLQSGIIESGMRWTIWWLGTSWNTAYDFEHG